MCPILAFVSFSNVCVAVNVHMPKDRVTMMHQGYGFVEFMGEEDADYAIKIMNMIKLYGKPIRVNKASAHQKNLDVGANIFIGNLDPEVDEKLLYDTFSAFGVILQTPKVSCSFHYFQFELHHIHLFRNTNSCDSFGLVGLSAKLAIAYKKTDLNQRLKVFDLMYMHLKLLILQPVSAFPLPLDCTV